MSRRRKQPVGKAHGGRGVKASPTGGARRRSPEERLNRILLLGGGGLVVGAILIALMAPRFKPVELAINLAAIGLGLLMGKGLGRLIYRRELPAGDK